MNPAAMLLIAIVLSSPGYAAVIAGFKGVPLGASSADAMKTIAVEGLDPPRCRAVGKGYTTCLSFNSNEKLVEEDFRRAYDAAGTGRAKALTPMRVAPYITYGGERAVTVRLHLIDDVFVGVSVGLNPRQVDRVIEALRAQHGEPHKTDRPVLTTLGGAHVENLVCTWEHVNGDRIVASRYANSLRAGGVEVTAARLRAHLDESAAVRAKAGASDL